MGLDRGTRKKVVVWQAQRGPGQTRSSFIGKVKETLTRGGKIDEELYERLEEILIQADVGVETSLNLIEDVRQKVAERRIRDPEEIQPLLAEGIREILRGEPLVLKPAGGEGPLTYVVVGVNGAGKTTTVGKLAARFTREGRRVLIGAGDTFRAAAIDQLRVWAERAGAELVAQQPGSDPAAVRPRGSRRQGRGADVLILDTAGRLQTKVNLMQELNKVYRVVVRELGRQPDESLLVVDGATGQNALSQGRLFRDAVPLTGLVLTKLDGTAKGGIVVSISRELDLPVKLIGIGEAVDDLRDFDPGSFVDALFATEETPSSL